MHFLSQLKKRRNLRLKWEEDRKEEEGKPATAAGRRWWSKTDVEITIKKPQTCALRSSFSFSACSPPSSLFISPIILSNHTFPYEHVVFPVLKGVPSVFIPVIPTIQHMNTAVNECSSPPLSNPVLFYFLFSAFHFLPLNLSPCLSPTFSL